MVRACALASLASAVCLFTTATQAHPVDSVNEPVPAAAMVTIGPAGTIEARDPRRIRWCQEPFNVPQKNRTTARPRVTPCIPRMPPPEGRRSSKRGDEASDDSVDHIELDGRSLEGQMSDLRLFHDDRCPPGMYWKPYNPGVENRPVYMCVRKRPEDCPHDDPHCGRPVYVAQTNYGPQLTRNAHGYYDGNPEVSFTSQDIRTRTTALPWPYPGVLPETFTHVIGREVKASATPMAYRALDNEVGRIDLQSKNDQQEQNWVKSGLGPRSSVISIPDTVAADTDNEDSTHTTLIRRVGPDPRLPTPTTRIDPDGIRLLDEDEAPSSPALIRRIGPNPRLPEPTTHIDPLEIGNLASSSPEATSPALIHHIGPDPRLPEPTSHIDPLTLGNLASSPEETSPAQVLAKAHLGPRFVLAHDFILTDVDRCFQANARMAEIAWGGKYDLAPRFRGGPWDVIRAECERIWAVKDNPLGDDDAYGPAMRERGERVSEEVAERIADEFWKAKKPVTDHRSDVAAEKFAKEIKGRLSKTGERAFLPGGVLG